MYCFIDGLSLSQHFRSAGLSSEKPFLPDHLFPQVQQCLREILSDYNSRDAGMSEVHFRKLFRSLYGVTPARYIIGQRIAYAKKLLELEEFHLEDVALQSGFGSLPYFCKVFKAETGTTPAAYRNTILK